MTSSPEIPPSRRRQGLFIVILAVLAVALAAQLSVITGEDRILPLHDFVEYWSAGRASLQGQNPYDREGILALQRQAGFTDPEPLMLWAPPWALTLLMPLGALPPGPGQLVWLAVLLACVLASADGLWRHYGGGRDQRWIGWLLAVTFVPTLFVLVVEQITALMLVGIFGFLHFSRQGRYLAAGCAAALFGIKPHLLYLFWFALLLWSVQRRQPGVILGGLLAGLAASLPPLALNPQVFHQYAYAVVHHPPDQFLSVTIGSLLRLIAGWQHFWLQFVPPGLGLLWLVAHWWQRRHHWDWDEQLPLLVMVSIITTCYGAWAFDLVLLLLPVLHVAAWAGQKMIPPRYALLAHLGINLLIAVQTVTGWQTYWYAWIGPAVLAAWLLLRRQLSRPLLDANGAP